MTRMQLIPSWLLFATIPCLGLIGCGDDTSSSDEDDDGNGGTAANGGGGQGGGGQGGGGQGGGGQGGGGQGGGGQGGGGQGGGGEGGGGEGGGGEGGEGGQGGVGGSGGDGGMGGSPMNCGNMAIDLGEDCDSGDIGLADCTTEGFAGGILGCDDLTCTFDTSGCFNVVETLTACDATYCTFTAGGGPRGGDLCQCTIPATSHPVADDVAGNLCTLYGNGGDLVWTYPTTGYLAYSVSTCELNPEDSSLAVYDGAPGVGTLIACNGDATDEPDIGMDNNYCSEITDSDDDTAALPTLLNGLTSLSVVVDEYTLDSYWDGTNPRTLSIELFSMVPAEVCNDTLDNDFDGLTDCADTDCFASASCAREVLVGCPAAFCTSSAGGGPNGGDLCTCVIPGASHPQVSNYPDSMTSCFGGDATGAELLWVINGAGYTSYATSTCQGTTADSSLATFSALPTSATEDECSEDAGGESATYCSKITDPAVGGAAALPTPIPATTFYAIIDEWNVGSYWNGTTSRTIQLELIP
jgi:hypothetical protein